MTPLKSEALKDVCLEFIGGTGPLEPEEEELLAGLATAPDEWAGLRVDRCLVGCWPLEEPALPALPEKRFSPNV
jgi:hypothetical protein